MASNHRPFFVPDLRPPENLARDARIPLGRNMVHDNLFCLRPRITTTVESPGDVRIEFIDKSGAATILKEKTPVLKGEVIDADIQATYARRPQ